MIRALPVYLTEEVDTEGLADKVDIVEVAPSPGDPAFGDNLTTDAAAEYHETMHTDLKGPLLCIAHEKQTTLNFPRLDHRLT